MALNYPFLMLYLLGSSHWEETTQVQGSVGQE